jgi:hypothetical protein
MQSVISKHELKRIIKSFLEDKKRGISMRLFAELAGISETYLQSIFLYELEPLTEIVQIRVSKAFNAWKNGEVSIMETFHGKRFIQYRKIAQPLAKKTLGLKYTKEGIKINLGIKPKYDYSGTNLDEELKRG